MPGSLFDRMTRGEEGARMSEDESIRLHLLRLLTARQGSVPISSEMTVVAETRGSAPNVMPPTPLTGVWASNMLNSVPMSHEPSGCRAVTRQSK